MVVGCDIGDCNHIAGEHQTQAKWFRSISSGGANADDAVAQANVFLTMAYVSGEFSRTFRTCFGMD